MASKSRGSIKKGRVAKEDSAELALDKEMKETTDKIDEAEDKKQEEFKKKLEKEGFLKRLGPYNRPVINIILGMIVSCIQGAIFPAFGIFLTKMLFSLMITFVEIPGLNWSYADKKDFMKDEAEDWCLYMFLCAVVCFCTTFTQKFCFGVVGENITLNIRDKLYAALLKKNIGWFDARENAPGVLTSVLASDA
jgi:ABC-type multidrug transport system fused ATPase/permease subunit